MSFVLNAWDLYRFYHTAESEVLAVRGVSLKVTAGEMVAVMGPSGSGKSTLLNCLSGIDEPDGGYVEIMGQRITRKAERERAAIRAKHIGILLQKENLIPHLTVKENICLQMALAGQIDYKRIEELLGELGMIERQYAYPRQLSGGENARAGLAVALASDPALLLADEPTGEVDRKTEELILDLLAAKCKQGLTAITSTHSLIIAARADRIVALQDGRINDAG
ncbi:abc transporter [Lucifera butyrica]|uniref:Abc transporter n=1 Tax=Lucifera butyrica TaxID=1351585 RepID=A0A498RBK4_9FIRM|nr:ABC transporter ATP-binding protein [Lucifera butyrica]VBB08287.1 abc transporter [Lucifera butyrica]